MHIHLNAMKDKILERLKQEFTNLGLSDELLNEEADMLASSGIVNDDNLETIVKGQENRLKKYQSSFDKLRTESAKYRKQIEELTKQPLGGNEQPKTEDNELLTWLKSFREEQDVKAKEATMLAERKERNKKIISKAKEIGISQERIDEGFAITENADDNEISTYLEKVRKNEIAKGLESKGSAFVIPSANDKGEELAKQWASNLPSM